MIEIIFGNPVLLLLFVILPAAAGIFGMIFGPGLSSGPDPDVSGTTEGNRNTVNKRSDEYDEEEDKEEMSTFEKIGELALAKMMLDEDADRYRRHHACCCRCSAYRRGYEYDGDGDRIEFFWCEVTGDRLDPYVANWPHRCDDYDGP